MKTPSRIIWRKTLGQCSSGSQLNYSPPVFTYARNVSFFGVSYEADSLLAWVLQKKIQKEDRALVIWDGLKDRSILFCYFAISTNQQWTILKLSKAQLLGAQYSDRVHGSMPIEIPCPVNLARWKSRPFIKEEGIFLQPALKIKYDILSAKSLL